jgi:hypothetical protein
MEMVVVQARFRERRHCSVPLIAVFHVPFQFGHAMGHAMGRLQFRKVRGEIECRCLSSFYGPPLKDFGDHVYTGRSWSLDFPKRFILALGTGSFNRDQPDAVRKCLTSQIVGWSVVNSTFEKISQQETERCLPGVQYPDVGGGRRIQ